MCLLKVEQVRVVEHALLVRIVTQQEVEATSISRLYMRDEELKALWQDVIDLL